MSQATDRLTASAQALSTSVEALIAKPAPPAPPIDESAVHAVADALDALKVKVDAAVVA